MQILDVLAGILVIGAAAAFVWGSLALARASDVEAIYCLVIALLVLFANPFVTAG